MIILNIETWFCMHKIFIYWSFLFFAIHINPHVRITTCFVKTRRMPASVHYYVSCQRTSIEHWQPGPGWVELELTLRRLHEIYFIATEIRWFGRKSPRDRCKNSTPLTLFEWVSRRDKWRNRLRVVVKLLSNKLCLRFVKF